ncbi:MAG: vWA domain-containing protein [Planctomycetota bacterium]
MNQLHSRKRQRRGAMLPLIAVAIVLLFVASVFAIDLARVHVVRSELRTATDAAARAAVEALGRTDSEEKAIEAALAVAKANSVAGKELILDRNKIIFGISQQNSDGTFTFTSRDDVSSSEPILANSVRVIGERINGSPDGPVNMMFGGLFGQSTFQPVQSATATRLDRDISLVLDKSGSMRSNGRFGALKNGVDVFIAELKDTKPKENVSLVVYDTRPEKLLDLTEDLDRIKTELNKKSPGGRTGIGRAMRVALDSVQNDPESRTLALKSIVVMTDGRQNEGVSPLTIAREARAANVVVHTITFSSGANQELMKDVARETGGTHLHATTNAQLVEAFQTIARQLQVLLIE